MSDAPDPKAQAEAWWATSIIDMKPGQIRLRGYPIEQLIGNVSYVETVWMMLRGELPSKAQAALLEAALVAAVDHGPQAPAVAIARMAVTAGNDLNHALGSGINVLGDVHGGAGQQAMEIYQAIHARMDMGAALEQAVDDELTAFFAHTKHLPGFGHRFHPVDPRAPRLMALVEDAAKAGTVTDDYRWIGLAVEAALARKTKRQLPMNIDGATAVIFCALGFPAPLGRGLFLLSRAVGLLAHAWEEMNQGTRIKGPLPAGWLYAYTGPPKRDVP
ncbi:MAG: citryl-CoA lyase [Rhodospirillales bacterium]|nr:citryl-CoA lyase [Rhodospirillales bacterium]